MAKAKAKHATLSGLIDSDSEDGQFVRKDAMPTPDSAAENNAPRTKGRGRPKCAPVKVTKTKAPARRTSGRLNTKTIAAVSKKVTRQALADRTNQQDAEDTEEVDEFALEDEVMQDTGVENSVPAQKQGRAKETQKPIVGARSKTAVESEGPKLTKSQSKVERKKAPGKRITALEPSSEIVIPETQVSTINIDEHADEEIEETIKRTAPLIRSRSDSRQPSVRRRRAGSASDTERERGEPALRRKLGEMTKKYDSLHIKYQDMKEVGLKEAERIFERYKKQAEEREKISRNLIDTLKSDLTKAGASSKESKGLSKKIDAQSHEIIALKAQIAQLNTSLAEVRLENKGLISESKNLSAENKKLLTENSRLSMESKTVVTENKALSAKLAANRTAAASVDSLSARGPGSAAKPNGGIRLMGSAEAAQLAQTAQLKEDLYSDLTGLIIRSVKRDSEEDIFDCIQTGRNGTLHFKLAAGNERFAESYEDVQCNYVPQLDPSRDKDLMDLLPDYLVDEITFPRPQAAKFYARVVKALMEKA